MLRLALSTTARGVLLTIKISTRPVEIFTESRRQLLLSTTVLSRTGSKMTLVGSTRVEQSGPYSGRKDVQ